MNNNKRFTFLWITTLLIGCLTASTTISANETLPEAPNFTLKNNSGKNLKLSEHRGQIVMINFWASWCGPCRQEMPELEKLYTKYKDLGFTVFGVNVEEDNNEAKKIITEANITFPVLFDNQNTVSRLYDVTAMPTTFIVDRDGMIRHLHRAYKAGDEDLYRNWIRQLIRE